MQGVSSGAEAVVDTRPAARFEGKAEDAFGKPGVIKGARNLPIDDLFDVEAGELRDVAVVKEKLLGSPPWLAPSGRAGGREEAGLEERRTGAG